MKIKTNLCVFFLGYNNSLLFLEETNKNKQKWKQSMSNGIFWLINIIRFAIQKQSRYLKIYLQGIISSNTYKIREKRICICRWHFYLEIISSTFFLLLHGQGGILHLCDNCKQKFIKAYIKVMSAIFLWIDWVYMWILLI